MDSRSFDKTKYYEYVRGVLTRSGRVNVSDQDVKAITEIYLYDLEDKRFDYVLTLIKNDKLVKQIAKLYYEPLVDYNDKEVDDIINRASEQYERRFLGNPHAMSDSYDDLSYEDYQEEFYQRNRKARR